MIFLKRIVSEEDLLGFESYQKELKKRVKLFSRPLSVYRLSSSQQLERKLNKEIENVHKFFKETLKLDQVELKPKAPIIENFNPDKIPEYLVSFLKSFYQATGFSEKDEKYLFRLLSIYLCSKLIDVIHCINMLKEENIRTQEELDRLNFKCDRLRHKVNVLNYYKRKPNYIGEALTKFTYQKLMLTVGNQKYTSIRLRMMIFILVLTGIQIQQLRLLKVYEWQSFLNSTSQHLTDEGRKVFKDRERDYKFLLKTKDSNSYLFTSESKHNKPLARESITRDINITLKEFSQSHLKKSKLTSYSFRIGYRQVLWKMQKHGVLDKELLSLTKLETARIRKEKS